MSLTIYSTKGANVLKEYTMVDGVFSFPSDQISYQTSNFVIVVFEYTGNRVNVLIDLLRTHSSFSDQLLQSLKGAFSFVIYDKVTKRIDAFRSLTADPIFYYHAKGEFFVSNSLQSLCRLSTDLDEDYFRMYLHTELTETEYTPYKGVKRLLPAHKITKNIDEGLITKKFWSINKSKMENVVLEDHIAAFSSILSEIVKDSVIDQKTIACEISGGLDSSSVSCLADRLKNKDSRMYGYTYIFDKIGDGESNKEKVGIIYQNTSITPDYLYLSNYWSFKDTKDGISFYDEPSPLILNFAMFRDLHYFAKQMDATILLSGEGGDELLSTSSHYLRDLFFQVKFEQVFHHIMRLAAMKKQPVWKIFSTHILPALLPGKLRYKLENQLNTQTWQNTGFYLNWYNTPPWIGEKLKKVTYEEVEAERRKIRDPNIESIYLKENFERLVLVNPCSWLNNNFAKPSGLNRIYPFRDQRLIEFVFSLPFLTKLEMSRKKKCIREGLQNIIPREILLKPDKSQFVEIFRKGFYQESSFVNELISTSRAAGFGWIKKDILQNAVERFRYGFNNEFSLISRTLGLELWLRHHGY